MPPPGSRAGPPPTGTEAAQPALPGPPGGDAGHRLVAEVPDDQAAPDVRLVDEAERRVYDRELLLVVAAGGDGLLQRLGPYPQALAATQLVPYQDPIGLMIQVGSTDSGIVVLEVVGVLEKTGLRPGSGIINREIDQDVYFPITLAQTKRLFPSTATGVTS